MKARNRSRNRYRGRFIERFLLLLCIFLAPQHSHSIEGKENGVIWSSWGEHLFDRAKSEKKLILLNLQAAWCHWCHVMDKVTYQDSEVVQILQKSFVSAAVQQDAHPALSSRYKEYGWPATIILNEFAEELEVLSGYIEPEEFKTTLRRVIAHPRTRKDKSPKPSDLKDEVSLERTLLTRFQGSLDHSLGGLRTSHRYLDSDSVEYAFRVGIRGDLDSFRWLHKTLEANRALIDPVWGGVYQYSTGRVWSNPHFEKLISSQSTSLFLYFLGVYAEHTRALYQDDVVLVLKYIKRFLSSPKGSFYVSQSAVVEGVEDNAAYFRLGDEKRRAKGIPDIDTHEYGRETALGIEALLYAYRVLGDASLLANAIQSGKWLVENRVRSDGFVAHDAGSQDEFFLADSVSAAKALLHLHSVTGDSYWLLKGEVVATRITDSFKSPDGVGFLSVSNPIGKRSLQHSVLKHVSLVENLSTGRVLNLYSYYLNRESFRDAAQSCMLAVSQPSLALSTISEPGILLLNEELSRAPIHVTLIGDPADSRAEELWKAILEIPEFYLQVERFSSAEAQMLGNRGEKIRYPKIGQPAAFLCANRTCSLPIFHPGELRSAVMTAMKSFNKEKKWR